MAALLLLLPPPRPPLPGTAAAALAAALVAMAAGEVPGPSCASLAALRCSSNDTRSINRLPTCMDHHTYTRGGWHSQHSRIITNARGVSGVPRTVTSAYEVPATNVALINPHHQPTFPSIALWVCCRHTVCVIHSVTVLTWLSSSCLCRFLTQLQAKKQPATAVAMSRLRGPSSRSRRASVDSSVSRDSSNCLAAAEEGSKQHRVGFSCLCNAAFLACFLVWTSSAVCQGCVANNIVALCVSVPTQHHLHAVAVPEQLAQHVGCCSTLGQVLLIQPLQVHLAAAGVV